MRLFFSIFMLLILSACSKGNSEANLKEGLAFLAENAKNPEIKTTVTGLQYKIEREGTGASPTAKDHVTVNYNGMFIKGDSFDSGEGISFPLNGVIPGWTEGVQLMKEGAKYRFFIPPELAYGDSGAGRLIGPNMTLIFDVELLKVN